MRVCTETKNNVLQCWFNPLVLNVVTFIALNFYSIWSNGSGRANFLLFEVETKFQQIRFLRFHLFHNCKFRSTSLYHHWWHIIKKWSQFIFNCSFLLDWLSLMTNFDLPRTRESHIFCNSFLSHFLSQNSLTRNSRYTSPITRIIKTLPIFLLGQIINLYILIRDVDWLWLWNWWAFKR